MHARCWEGKDDKDIFGISLQKGIQFQNTNLTFVEMKNI